jgi:putative transposase
VDLTPEEKRVLVDRTNELIPISRQASLLGIARSTVYYEPVVDPYDIELMRLIDEQYTKTPFYGSRRITVSLKGNGHKVNRKRVQGLMRVMGIEAIYPKPRLSEPHQDHKIYPYLLRDVKVTRSNQVWGSDITYIRLSKGWAYLVAIMDWFSRYVVAWELSTSLEVDFCLFALERALVLATPEIFNSDQGSQFTSTDFVCQLEQKDIRISMDGRGRFIDNIFTERLWRSLKYEEVYLKDYQSVREARQGIDQYLTFYNLERPHQSLGDRTPAEIYFGRTN